MLYHYTRQNLYKKFVRNEEPPKEYFDMLGANRDYNVDLIPKFIMANGKLVKILVHTDVTRYLDFKLIDGSYVYKAAKEGGWLGGGNAKGVHKVPATEAEALKTGLVGFMQKRSLHSFLKYIAKYEQANSATHEGMDITRATAAQLFDKFGLDAETRDFVGHAMALQPDDSYLTKPAAESVEAVRLYAESLDRYGKSPFIYPVYGLGGLPEGFSRLCAIHGGTFILNKGVDEILLNEDGTAAGVRSGSGDDAEAALAPIIIGDPSYFPAAMVRKTGRVIRTICILDHPIAGVEVPDSAQIIIPQSQANRSNGACDLLQAPCACGRSSGWGPHVRHGTAAWCDAAHIQLPRACPTRRPTLAHYCVHRNSRSRNLYPRAFRTTQTST
jgi:Rab GDP dissociation inhibitor